MSTVVTTASVLKRWFLFGQPGTECALRPISMYLIVSFGSVVLTDHALLKLSSSAIALFEKVLRDLSFTAGMKSLV